MTNKKKKLSIQPGILVVKGNFTQRQFDALGRIWDSLQKGENIDWTLPCLQLSEKGDIGILSIDPSTGKMSAQSLFSGCNCKCNKEE